jgi:ribosomal protein S9
MAEHPKAKVWVNKTPVELNEFVESFFASVSISIVKTLKGVDYIKKVEIHQEKGDVTIKVNGEEIPITPFPNEIINNTIMGMLSPLKGFDKVDQLDIIVEV